MSRFSKYMIAATLGGASAAAVMVGYNFVGNVKFAHSAENVEVTRQQLSTITDLSTVFRAIGKVVEPSVVNIHVRKVLHSEAGANRVLPFDDETLKRFFPDRNGDGKPDLPPGFGGGDDGADQEQEGTGSGVVMEVENGVGYILTNNHVAGGATELDITLSDGREIKNGKVLGTDPKSDLAVVKIEADKLIPAKWGNSDELDRGDWVLAFGSPFGYVGSMTHGIVSALNRQAGLLDKQSGYENFIQVDAPINPGNSGGPLVNLRGEVVGVNTAIASQSGGSQGIGFAIPSNQAHFVYDNLKNNGHVTRGWLGVGIKDVAAAADVAASLGYTSKDGVFVEQTFRGTPAFNKLNKGDVVTKIDGKAVNNTQELRNQIAITAPGKEVDLTVFRDGKETDVKIKVGEQPEDLAAVRNGKGDSNAKNDEASGGAAIESMGLRLATPTDALLDQFKITDEKEGALVVDVAKKSAAFKAGLQPGDLITEVGTVNVKSAEQAKEEIAKGDLDKGIRLYVVNAVNSRFVIIKKQAATAQ